MEGTHTGCHLAPRWLRPHWLRPHWLCPHWLCPHWLCPRWLRPRWLDLALITSLRTWLGLFVWFFDQIVWNSMCWRVLTTQHPSSQFKTLHMEDATHRHTNTKTKPKNRQQDGQNASKNIPSDTSSTDMVPNLKIMSSRDSDLLFRPHRIRFLPIPPHSC